MIEKQTKELAVERSKSKQLEDKLRELGTKFMNTQNMAIIAPEIAVPKFKMPKPDRSQWEIRQQTIGINLISRLSRNSDTVHKALVNLFMTRKNIRTFTDTLAWLVDLGTKPIDWDKFEQWLEIIYL